MNVELTKGIKEPICGWQWVQEHYHDLDGWTPTIELKAPGFRFTITSKDRDALNKAVKIITK